MTDAETITALRKELSTLNIAYSQELFDNNALRKQLQECEFDNVELTIEADRAQEELTDCLLTSAAVS